MWLRERPHKMRAERLPFRELAVRHPLGDNEVLLQLRREGGILHCVTKVIVGGGSACLIGRDLIEAAQFLDEGLICTEWRDVRTQRRQQLAFREDEDPHRALPSLVRAV